MNQKSEIAVRLKAVRKSLNMKQTDFAARLGISDAAISDIENGKYTPKFDSLVHMVREFKVNPYYLLLGEGEMFVDELSMDSMDSLKLFVDRDDFKKFLWYFQHSNVVQYSVMSHFFTILKTDAESIEANIKHNDDKKQ